MTEQSWKRTERRIAALLGGQRAPITGRRGADVAHPQLAIEVKHRKALPQWLQDSIAQAVACAEAGQLPIVVLHEAGQRHGNDLAIMRLSDFTARLEDCDPARLQ